MTERDIDAERAGTTGNAAPKRTLAAPEMTLAEALEYHARFDWKTVPTKSDRAREALVAEVRRLLFEMEADS